MRRIFFTVFVVAAFGSVHAQAWEQRTNFGNVGRHRASGFSIGNRGYLGLGHVNGTSVNVIYRDWWAYDPSSDAWTQKADFPVAAGNYGAIAFATDTKGYIGGGATLNGEFYEYDPFSNTWSQVASCPGTPTDQGCFCVNNKGYVIQGNLLWEYDPALDVWTPKANAPISFTNWCAGFSIGSSGYIKSGTSLFEYKPANNTWIQKSSFPGNAYNGSGAFVRNGKAYIITGYINSLSNVTSQVWEFNPGSNSWTQCGDFPGTSRRFSVAFSINDRGYFGTGTNGINFNDFWEMNDGVSTQDISSTKTSLNLFPSPATEFVNVVMHDAGATNNSREAVIYNSLGQRVRNIDVPGSEFRIERNDLPAGTYFIIITSHGITEARGQFIFD